MWKKWYYLSHTWKWKWIKDRSTENRTSVIIVCTMLTLHVRYLEAQKHLKVTWKPMLLTSRIVRIKSANKLVIMQTDGSTRRQRVMLARRSRTSPPVKRTRPFWAVEVTRDHVAPSPSPQLPTLGLCYVTCEQKWTQKEGDSHSLYVTLNKKKKVWKAEECGKSYFSVECASTRADRNGKILQRRELNVSKKLINCSKTVKYKCDRFKNNIVNKTSSYRITCRWSAVLKIIPVPR